MIALISHNSHKNHESHKTHAFFRALSLSLSLFLSFLNISSPLFAQEVTVTVTPTQPILPPQVMLYITEPSNYFNISLTNTGKDDANIYLVMQVEQVMPSSGLSLSTPARRQPKLPIVVPAGSTHILSPSEIRSLFNHIPLNEIQAPQDLFDNYANGSFGLLPEGQYELHMTAYRWNLALTEPVVASSPSGGCAVFSVCYNAQAPEFLTPMAATQGLLAVAEMNPLAPQFTWKAPVVACNPSALQYTYSLRIVEVLPGQAPDNSMDSNPVVYQVSNLSTPMCMIPQSVIKQMTEGKTYAAQVTATSATVNRAMLNYVSIANNGKSTYKLFRLNSQVNPVVPELDNEDEDVEDEDDSAPDPEDEMELMGLLGGIRGSGEISEDSLYTYRNPKLVEPVFIESAARKVFVEEDIDVEWEPVWHLGGEGTNPGDNKFEYELRLYKGSQEADREATLKTEPIYTLRTQELKQTIEWKDIEENVAKGDYILMEVKPIVTKGESIAFTGEDNITDFGLCERLSQKYFQCSDMVQINDKTPTTKSAQDLKGKVVAMGEYLLTIDDIKGSAAEGFSGSGRVEWTPFGSKIMVCVTFDKLKINKEDIVYEGTAVTAKEPAMLSSMEVVDKLFSDWGIDNLISDTGLPYAKQIQDKATSEVKSLAEKVNLGTYYKKLQDGKEIGKLLTTGTMDKLYMPVRFPKELLQDKFDAVDLQIVEMKFTPTYATMNILGEATMPECDVLKSKVLVFGAPRICISPNQFLPEAGHVALLGDFTLTPSADIEMTFKAPKNVLEPSDGCYISWKTVEEKTKLELLGVDIDMKIADLVKDVNGTPTDETPIMNLKASVGSWDDFLVDHISIEDFQVKDLPGWTFKASDIVYDHTKTRNSEHMGAFPKGYNKKLAGCDKSDLLWQGLHIGKVGVGFPKSLQVGVVDDKGDKRLWVDAKEMYWDQSGVTVTIGAENLFEGKEGTLGGWGISLDEAHVQIIQSDFDNAGFSGQINIPILKTASKKDGEGDKGKAKEKERFGNVDYTCQIRSLTSVEARKKGEKARYSYVFLTENVGELDFSFFIAHAKLDDVQTYFLVEAFDEEKADKIKTQVELCMGGEIGIGLVDDANDWIKKKTKNLPLELKIPDVHFTKMRLSNVKRSEWISVDEKAKEKRSAREQKEEQIRNKALAVLMESDEINIGTADEPFYFDLGEWSLASEKKHLGPFSFSLDKFSPGYSDGRVTLQLGGSLGLLEDKIDVSASVVIAAKLNTKGDLKDWSIEYDTVEFKKLSLDMDFTAIHLKGELEATDKPNKGYKGTLDIGITGFFNLDCEGGYFEHKKDEKNDDDESYSWGYFMANLESAALRFDPVVIDRISGGFFFNCRPTKGKGGSGDEPKKSKNKFNGDPTPKKGCIGIAFGLGLSSSAGKETLSADLDMLVVFDTKNNCFSTFMLDGTLEAVGGMVKANCSLMYENEKDMSGNTKNRYLCLNVTVEAGADTKALVEKVTKANAALEALKGKFTEFQEELDPQQLFERAVSPKSDMSALSGNEVDAEETKAREPSDEEKKELGITACKTEINLEFKVTWVKDGQKYSTPKWHLYLGEPAKDKRCRFTFLKYDGVIVNVDIGADAYLCLGNELPDGGALPAIPSTITEFLSGHKADKADMGADLGKAERSRKAAAKKLLDPNSCEGGIMVGASAWGHIGIDLGLFYGSLDAIAGFDAALVNYGNNAFCVNSGSHMGYNGWYAMGQLYAYLAAQLGIHVHIGSLINEKVSIFDAGIGGVLEIGLPNPTWVEGSARIKISLLGGLCKINKKFDFSAGDHCVPFKGNALDGFEMFQSVSHGSDSLYQALLDPTFAISLNEAKNMTFTTQSSIGSHYRLVDPSWESELADKEEVKQEDLEKSYALNASRTYVFDINKDKNRNGMKMGVRLFDLGDGPTRWMEECKSSPIAEHGYAKSIENGTIISPKDLKDLFVGKNASIGSYRHGNNQYSEILLGYTYDERNQYESAFASNFVDLPRSETVNEASIIMQGKELSNGPIKDPLSSKGKVTGGWTNRVGGRPSAADLESFLKKQIVHGEVNVSFREDKGTTFHLSNMDLKAGHSYMMILSADAYEIDNGRKVWCEYYSEKDRKNHRIHWQQNKVWFFRIKSEEEEKIVTDSLRFLEPYVALAYPSTNGTRVVDNRGEGVVKAYYTDIMHPTIALNRDIRKSLPVEKMQWVLTYTQPDGTNLVQTRNAVYKTSGNCINLEPQQAFKEFNQITSLRNQSNKGTYNFDQEQYHLQLLYTYFHKKKESALVPNYNEYGRYLGKIPGEILVDDKDSTFALVDLYVSPLPHHLQEKKVDGEWYRADNWLLTTTSSQTEPVAYSKPFIGGTIDQAPTIEYEKDYYSSRGGDLLTDEDIVFKNAKFDGITNAQGRITNRFNLPYRLIDPYLYFAYLGKWVFIGDREISAYSFDNVPVKFGSESLIFNYNGTVVNSEFLKGQTNKSLLQLRKQMYGVWNTWNYNDSNHPKYPLPSVGGTIGGITAANQDGKASTVTPLNINHYTDYTYVFEDLVKDYLGAYQVASKLCTLLNTYSTQLVRKFYNKASFYESFNSNSFDKAFNESMQEWNSLHRGQYIEASDRGYTVRVPMYQLPLVFGDCFGNNAKFGNTSLNRSKRTFTFSIGENDMKSGDAASSNLSLRWPSAASNLLFFRLNDGGNQSSTYYGYNALPFKYFDGDKWSLYSSNYKNSVSIEHDQFDVHKALQAVTGFKARLYRVDCYDIETGLYKVSPNKNFGGGPWEKVVTIGTGNATASNMDKMYEASEEMDAFLETHFDKPTVQAVWCDNEKTLVFLVSDIDYSSAIGEKIANVGKVGDETYAVDGTSAVEKRKGWYNYAKNDCEKVIFDPSFKNADISTCYHWFYNFKKLKTVEGLQYLPKTITSTSGMFQGCTSLTSLDFKGIDLSNVTDMGSMFSGCTSLTSVNLNKCKANKVTTMFGMFSGCTSLTSARLMDMETESLTNTARMFSGCWRMTLVDLTRFNTSQVEDMYNMFENCESLTSLNLSSFEGGNVRQMGEMFYNCKKLTSIDMRNFDTGDQKNPSMSRVFAGCKALRTLNIDALNPNITFSGTCMAMFDQVTAGLTCYYFCDLTPYIADQIPGAKKPQPDNRAKVIHARLSNGTEALFFLYSTQTFSKNSSYTITTSITPINSSTPERVTHNIKVLDVWSGDDVFNTGFSKPKWATTTIASAVRNVYIDDNFAATPRSTYSWFYGFDKITEIRGLSNLKTDKVTNMGYMFNNCSSLTSLDFTKNKFDEVTNMSFFCYGCTDLATVKGLTSPARFPKVTDMCYMFYHCEGLTSLPCYGGPEVRRMNYMYTGCTGFEYKGSTPTITSDKVTTMADMFHGCSNLRNTFKFTSTANVTDMSYMYASCSSLREINMGTLNTENVRLIQNIFSGCSSAYLIDLGEMSTKRLSNCGSMFRSVPSSCTIYIAYDATSVIRECPLSTYPKRILVYPASAVVLRSGGDYKLHFVGEKITMKRGDTYNRSPYSGYVIQDVYSGTFVQNRVRNNANIAGPGYKEMWNYYAKNITEVTVDASFKKVELINAYGYFQGMSRLTAIKGIGNLSTSNAQDLGSFFKGCTNLSTLEGSRLSTASATQLDYMFSGCEKLSDTYRVDFGSTDVATDMSHMFENCKALENLTFLHFPHTGKATNLAYMFYGCSSLWDLPLSDMKTDNVEVMTCMFQGCTSMTNFSGLKKWNVSKVRAFSDMFRDCTSLAEIDLSLWNTNSPSPNTWRGARSISGMFRGCTALHKITLGSNFTFDYIDTYSSSSTFTNVKNVNVFVPKENLADVKKALTSYHGFVIGTTGQILDDTTTETAQVLWTPSNKTVTFYYGIPIAAGSTFNGYRVEKVWSNGDVLSNNSDVPKWASTVQGTVTTVVFDKTFSKARPTSTRAWFTGCRKLTNVKNIENLNTFEVTNMSRMFMNCENLTSLEFKTVAWSTAKVTEMNSMFSGCKALTNIDMSAFYDTRKVTNIGSMFSNCPHLEELDLSAFSTAAVTSANYLFNACYALKTLKVGNSFTCASLKTKASYAFSGVSNMEIQATSSVLNSVKSGIKNNLGFVENPGGTNGEFVATDKMGFQAIWTSSNKTLTFYYGKEYKAGSKFNGNTITNVWKFSGSNTPWLNTVKGTMTYVDFHKSMKDHSVTSCSEWFKGCSKLKYVYNIGNLNTSSCTSFSSMFYGCESLSRLDVNYLDVSKASSFYCMFYGCTELGNINVSRWNTSKVISMAYMFSNCRDITDLDLSNFDVSNVITFRGMFSSSPYLWRITGLDKWNTVSAKDMSYMFYGCERLSTFKPTNFNTVNVTDMSYMFYGCEKWSVTSSSSAPRNYNVSNVTNMSYMFYRCKGITYLDLSNWKTGKVTNMSYMFGLCTGLKTTDFSKWDTRAVTSMAGMFYYCTAIKNLSLTSFSTPALTTMRQMFYKCETLRSVDLHTFDLSNVSDMSYMFAGCRNCPYIDLRVSKKIKAGVNMYYIFNDTWDPTEKYGGASLDINPNFVVTQSQNCGWPTKPDDYFNYSTVYVTTNDRSVVTSTKNTIITTMKNMGYKGWNKGEKPAFLYRFSNGKTEWIEY